MSDTMLLSRIFGPLLAILGIWCLWHQQNHAKVIESFKNAPGLVYLLGTFNLVIGLTIVNLHPEWNQSLAVLITILGWVMIIRAVIMLFVQKHMMKLTFSYERHHVFYGVVSIIWGLILCWMGFMEM